MKLNIKVTKTEKIISIILLLIGLSFSLDLLNYKDWLKYSIGWILIVLIVSAIIYVTKSFFKPKI